MSYPDQFQTPPPSPDPNSEPNQFQSPPPPQDPGPSEPPMSAAGTLTSIFFEPGTTFEALRQRPRFLIAGLITIALFMAFQIAFTQKVGYERLIREEVESGPRADQTTPEQKDAAIRIQNSTIVKVIRFVITPVFFAIFFAAGAALYLLGAVLMGKPITYSRALAVWVYATLPPILLTTVINLILLFIKSPDDYDILSASRRGLVKANLSILADAKAAPILYTVLGSLDVFAFYGLFLGALGLRKVGKMSSGSAWGIVLTIWIVGVVLRIAGAAIFGQGM
jgi:hypothetical protein